MDSETRIQALRGAAATKTVNVGNHETGIPSANTFVLAVPSPKKREK